MKKYIIVLHTWFVDCGGFEVREIEAEGKKEAEEQAILIKHDLETSMRHVAFTVVPILEHQRVARKLTFMERLLGWAEV